MKLSSSNFDKPGKIEKKKTKETPKETPSPSNSSTSTPGPNNPTKKRKPEAEKVFKENKTPKVETPVPKPKGYIFIVVFDT